MSEGRVSVAVDGCLTQQLTADQVQEAEGRTIPPTVLAQEEAHIRYTIHIPARTFVCMQQKLQPSDIALCNLCSCHKGIIAISSVIIAWGQMKGRAQGIPKVWGVAGSLSS